VVELPPAVLPSLDNRGDQGVGERVEYPLGGRAVRGELERPVRLGFFESLGGQLDEARAKLLGLVPAGADDRPDQLKMSRSLSKKP
jgi:hypothetical protein